MKSIVMNVVSWPMKHIIKAIVILRHLLQNHKMIIFSLVLRSNSTRLCYGRPNHELFCVIKIVCDILIDVIEPIILS